jgi:AcrR family transcriptional regulator
MSRADLLNRVIAYLADAGVGDRSLRQIAAGAGTSHRMLIYHFGTRDALLVEVVRAVEERQRVVLAGLRSHTPREMALEFWRRLADPALAPYERLFFELYGAALAGRESVAPVLDGIVSSWLADESMFAGLPAAQARMALAFSRGALLDLLATDDRAGVDAAVLAFVDLVWPSTPPPSTPPANASPPSGASKPAPSGPPEEPQGEPGHGDDTEHGHRGAPPG